MRSDYAALGRTGMTSNRVDGVNFIVITVAGLLLTCPAWMLAFPPNSHDGWIHSLWYTQFSAQLYGGEVYPRWLLDLNQGLGSPSFFYYPPFPYYACILFKALFPNDPLGLQQLGAAAGLAATASGWTMYLWLRRLVSPLPAVGATILYLLMPYHTAIDLYVRGAYAEFWAFVWMPLILYFVHRLRSGEPGGIAGVAVGYAFLIASHLPSALLFSPVPLLYAWMTADRNRKGWATMAVTAAMGAGIGLAGIYLLPAVLMRPYVSMQQMQIPALYFENWFMLTSFFTKKLNSILSWLIVSMMFLIGYAVLISRHRTNDALRRERAAWIVVSLSTIVIMTPISGPLWRMLPLLQNVQFPFRYMAILCLAVAALMAIGFSTIPGGEIKDGRGGRLMRRRDLALHLGLGLTLIAWVVFLAYSVRREYLVYAVTPAADRGRISENRDAPEYLPRWSNRQALLRLTDARGGSAQSRFQAQVVGGSAWLQIIQWQPRNIRFQVSAPQDARIRIGQLFYAGWRAQAKGDGRELTVAPSYPEGLLELNVPAGNHEIDLQLTSLWPERVGKWVTVIALVLLLIVERLYVGHPKRGVVKNRPKTFREEFCRIE